MSWHRDGSPRINWVNSHGMDDLAWASSQNPNTDQSWNTTVMLMAQTTQILPNNFCCFQRLCLLGSTYYQKKDRKSSSHLGSQVQGFHPDSNQAKLEKADGHQRKFILQAHSKASFYSTNTPCKHFHKKQTTIHSPQMSWKSTHNSKYFPDSFQITRNLLFLFKKS